LIFLKILPLASTQICTDWIWIFEQEILLSEVLPDTRCGQIFDLQLLHLLHLPRHDLGVPAHGHSEIKHVSGTFAPQQNILLQQPINQSVCF
jgi:hypothetical protein